jgi:hypothetical protein
VNVSGPDRSAKEQLREQLIQAARRDVAQERRAQQPRRRRRRRRGTGLIVAVVLGGAAAAGAADLISAGDPVPDTTSSGKQYKPPTPGAPELVAKAPDPQRGTAWGVGIYTADNGQQCAIAGQVRGVSLGLVRDGVFRAYASGSSGACADLKRMPMLFDRLVIDGPQPRTIVFGRTRASDRTVITKSDGKVYSTKPGRGGGFLFVFEGRLAFADVRPRLGPPIGP